MVALPLLSGVVGTEEGEFVQTYPLNLEPVIIDSKISKGQLRAAPGAVRLGTGPGNDRGGIFWNNQLYRVMGTKLVAIAADGGLQQISDVGGSTRCWFDYSFDRLAIGSGGRLFYYTAADGLEEVTDEDLGNVIDGIWISGYFMVTDGTYVVVTELSDSTSVLPLKYGSAEDDPDPIVGLLKYRNEAYIVGRHTIQLFRNVGGGGFPFATQPGGTIPYGCVGTNAKCLFGDGFAFVGSARGEALNVYIAASSQARAFGNRAVCDALAALDDPSSIEIESRSSRGEQRLLVHLPDETWVFLADSSSQAGQPIWFRMKTGSGGYRPRNAVQAFGEAFVGDALNGTFGILSYEVRAHFGVEPEWSFDAGMIYNEALGAIVHSIELVGLPGRGGDGTVFLSMSRDGQTWSVERSVRLGPIGTRRKRIAWRPHARIGNYLGLRFRGVGASLPGIAAVEVKAVPLTS